MWEGTEVWSFGWIYCLVVTEQFLYLCHAVCAEAFNPDEDEEDKEPRVSCSPCHIYLHFPLNQTALWILTLNLNKMINNMTYSVWATWGPDHRCVLFCRSPTQKLMSRDRGYRKRVGTFFCLRIWIRWVDYSISTLYSSGLCSAISQNTQRRTWPEAHRLLPQLSTLCMIFK